MRTPLFAIALSLTACAAEAPSDEAVRVQVRASALTAQGLGTRTCTPSRPDADGSFARIQTEVVDRVNAVRTTAGLAALTQASCLEEVAWKHSQALSEAGTPLAPPAGWPHVLDGRGPADRLNLAGIDVASVRENVYDAWETRDGAVFFDDATLARRAVDWWLASPPHRATLLATDVTFTAVGVVRKARGDRGEYWVTQLFAAE